jgi:nicotinate-nucleotide adenylyltransferase
MRLGLFGGSFDPVHYGHLLLAECAREQHRLDQVLFLPAAVPPHKQGRVLSADAARIEMLQLAIGGHPSFSASRYEIDQGGVSYTVDTLRHFTREQPGAELFLLLGADTLYDLPRWRESAEVCRLAVPLVAQRAGVEQVDFRCLSGIASLARIDFFRQHLVEMPSIGLSSSEIRSRVAQSRSIRYWTPRAVEQYIETHQLYRA